MIIVLLINIIKLIIISTSMLIDDEAYYALWTKHLPIGFFDHPAGIAFFMKLSTLLFGYTDFGVRFGSIIFNIIVSIFIYNFFEDKDEGIIALILFNIIPFFTGLSLIITIDTPMFYFLFLSVIFYYKAIFDNDKYFYIASLCMGFAILSKISSLLVFFSIILYSILFSNNKKYILKSYSFYLSFVIIILINIPFVIHIFDTDYAPIYYILDRLEKPGSINRTLDFWIAQFILLTPLFFSLFIVLMIKYCISFFKKNISQRYFYFLFISLIPFLYIFQKSLKNKLEANWSIFIYIGLFFIISFFISQNFYKKYIRVLFILNNILSFIIILIIFIQYITPIINIPSDPTDRYYKYSSIKYDMKHYYDNTMSKDIRIFSLNYQIPSMVNFYISPSKEAVCLNFGTYHPTVFDFWYKDDNFVGDNFYYLGTSTNIDVITNFFDDVEYITNFTSIRKPIIGEDRKLDTFYLFLCKNYKGNNLKYIYKGNKFSF